MTGNYTILVGDRDGDNTVYYGLYLQRTNNPGHDSPIAFGETKTDSITKPGPNEQLSAVVVLQLVRERRLPAP